ncbi:hypothetical protein CMV60_15450 [Serratia marcescens]|nr:hypothetical protein CMV60_15450 [Serratia marcescens]
MRCFYIFEHWFFFRKLIVCFIWFFSTVVYATDPVTIVYRIDSRSPSKVFSLGFTSWGADNSLLRHVSGENIQGRTSAFISTTSNWGAIERMAEIVVGFEPGSQAWIYTITPSRNFYDINGSLLRLSTIVDPAPEAEAERRQAIGLYRQYGWQEEFAALGIIEGNQVISARAITRNDVGLLDIADYSVFNSRYDHRRTPETNNAPIRTIGALSSNTYYFGEFERRPVSPAFGVYECRSPTKSIKGKKNTNDCFTKTTSEVIAAKNKRIGYIVKLLSFMYF